MSQLSCQLSWVRVAGMAAGLTVVAAPFAIGGELPGWLLRPALASATTTTATTTTSAVVAPVTAVERATKSDRAAVAARSRQTTRTFSIQPSGLAGTSILLRIPDQVRTHQAIDVPPRPIKSRELISKPRVACEPVVSVLTEVAKQLGPGRCVT